MTIRDHGPAALMIHPTGDLAVLVWRSSGDAELDEKAWNQAVAEAAAVGLVEFSDEPDALAGGVAIYVLTR